MSGPRLEEVPCNLCGADDSVVRHEQLKGWPESADFAATTDRYGAYGTIRQCRACGLAYTNPRPAAAALLEGYAQAEDPDYLKESESRCMNAYLSLAILRRFAPAGGRLLEVGCSAGFFLNAARLHYEVEGVEPAPWARAHAQDKLKLDARHATLEEARYPDKHFDAAAAIDVIEHLPDPAGFLKELKRVLKPGGVLYLVTPDLGSLSAMLLGGRWWGLRPAHIYYFSKATLTELLRRQGFEVLYARSYGRIFTWGYWLSRLANYPRPVRAAVRFVVELFGVEDKFLYLDTRDSVQVVARRLA